MHIGNNIGCPQPNMCIGRFAGSSEDDDRMISERSWYLCDSISGTIPPMGCIEKLLCWYSDSAIILADLALRSWCSPPWIGPFNIIFVSATCSDFVALSAVILTASSISFLVMSGLPNTSNIVPISTPIEA